ncbi:undecaprenyl-diphosphate phosphatase [candidate division WOR-3 bacterium]|nr:undecaprenyl-diphosphate phosphatase [candidate division WOR-3 bacterium]
MTLLESVLLGLVQGATEFLPVSSSGHLLLVEHLLAVPAEVRLALTAALHLGTAFALLGYFARRIGGLAAGLWARGPARRRASLGFAGLVLLGSLPAAGVGLGLGDAVDAAFSRPAVAGAMLLVTGGLLFATRYARDRSRPVGWRVALLVGLAQAVAIMPGISRSGATISVALLLGVGAVEAFEFSFLLSIPAVLGAAGLELARFDWSVVRPLSVAVGAVVALAAGLGALVLLRRAVVGRWLPWFAPYCWLVGTLVLLLLR